MYFSDKELGTADRISEDISIEVWNGIVSIFEEFKFNNSFSSKFPQKCSDYERVYSFDENLFEDRIKAEIKNIKIPLKIKKKNNHIRRFKNDNEPEYKTNMDKYMVLDFIQFCHKNIQEAIEDDYHSYFQHYHLKFRESKKLKKDFRKEINQIFERNGIVFFINDEGQINRIVSPAMQPLINKIYNTKDEKLNELVQLAHDKFILPNIVDRIHALEKIWDAFERVKTYYVEKNKKQSVEELIQLVANKNSGIEQLINNEAKALTSIGNTFHIRHFETDKIEITDNKHIDYLFYRMSSLIHLFLTGLE
jgi:hypothetical protein